MGITNGRDYDPPADYVRADRGSSQVVQVETMGKAGLVIFLVMFVVIAALAVIAGYALGVGEARAEDIDTRLRQMNARVSVLEYDSSQVYGELRARGLINGTHPTE
jgi:outer membrane murein-binding lipoprotein Lpp